MTPSFQNKLKAMLGRLARKIALATVATLLSPIASAAQTPSIYSQIAQEIAKKYPGARIEVAPQLQVSYGKIPAQVSHVRVVSENNRGQAQVVLQGAEGSHDAAEAWVSFSAWMPALVAARRVTPGERLQRESFQAQDVNVASGMAREYRGVILPPASDLAKLEASQTILEGQFALSSGVRKVPDLRKGEAVRIRMISGDVVLSTQGLAEEPGYLDQQVRVLTLKTKKLLVGRLLSGGIVEVGL